MSETQSLSRTNPEHDHSMSTPLQSNSRMTLAMPPGQPNDFQTAANNSYQVSQLKALQPGSGLRKAAPIQRKPTLEGESKKRDPNDPEGYNRYKNRVDLTAEVLGKIGPKEDADHVRLLVFSGKFGLLGKMHIPEEVLNKDKEGEKKIAPAHKYVNIRAGGKSHPELDGSTDGEMYLITKMNSILADYIKRHRSQLSPGRFTELQDSDEWFKWNPNQNPLKDEIRVEILGPQGTCKDCQSALRVWVKDAAMKIKKQTKWPQNKLVEVREGGAGTVKISVVARWIDGNQIQTNKRKSSLKKQSTVYGSRQAAWKQRVKGASKRVPHHYLLIAEKDMKPTPNADAEWVANYKRNVLGIVEEPASKKGGKKKAKRKRKTKNRRKGHNGGQGTKKEESTMDLVEEIASKDYGKKKRGRRRKKNNSLRTGPSQGGLANNGNAPLNPLGSNAPLDPSQSIADQLGATGVLLGNSNITSISVHNDPQSSEEENGLFIDKEDSDYDNDWGGHDDSVPDNQNGWENDDDFDDESKGSLNQLNDVMEEDEDYDSGFDALEAVETAKAIAAVEEQEAVEAVNEFEQDYAMQKTLMADVSSRKSKKRSKRRKKKSRNSNVASSNLNGIQGISPPPALNSLNPASGNSSQQPTGVPVPQSLVPNADQSDPTTMNPTVAADQVGQDSDQDNLLDQDQSAQSSNSSNCYLTTACVTFRGLPDDCEELTTLRWFRDHFLLHQSYGPALVRKYYTYAPNIVQNINDQPDPGAIYDEIYAVVRECVRLIQAGELEATFDLYCEMVEEMRERYAGAVLIL